MRALLMIPDMLRHWSLMLSEPVDLESESGYRALVRWYRRERLNMPADGELLATLHAYVSEGRWVADCPVCHSGIAVGPWDWACCFGCGGLYRIRFPDNREAIERALLRRPPRHRHWFPGETVQDLEAENAAHGVT